MLMDMLFDNKNNVCKDSYDKMMWEELQERPKIKSLVAKGTKVLKDFPALSEDIFNTLFKVVPVLTDRVPYGTELNRKQIEHFIESGEFITTRDYTVLDEYSSAMASTTVLQEVITRMESDEDLKKLAQEQNQNEKKQEELKKKAQSKDPQQAELAKRQLEQNRRDMQNKINSKSGAIRRAVTAGIKKAEKQAEDDGQLMDNLGWSNGDVKLKQMALPDRATLMEQARKIKHIAEYVGKMRALVSSCNSSKLKSQQVELCGVTMGNDVSKALPQELVQLRHPVLKYNFYRKFAEHQLLQYELTRNENAGKGHIICLLDDSGSMEGVQSLARGFMMGLLECAKSNNRNFALDIFSSYRNEFKREFEKGVVSPQETLDILTVNFGGGTSYDNPIHYAMDTAKTNKFKKADIVLITDGECDLNGDTLKELLKFKKETDTKVIMIQIGGYHSNEQESWVDKFYTDLGEETLTDISKTL